MPHPRALVIRPGAIGDAIVTLPLIQNLASAYEVDLVTGTAAAGLLQGRCAARSVMDFGAPRWASLFHPRLPEDMHRFLQSYEWLFIIVATSVLHVAERLANQLPGRVIGWSALPDPNRPVHIATYLQQALRATGIPIIPAVPQIDLTAQDRAAADHFLRDHALIGDLPVIALHPGSGSPSKNWPAERFAELAFVLGQERSPRFLLIGGPADRETLAAVQQAWRGAQPVLADTLPLPHIGALLARCTALVGNDSGIAHLAAALAVPTLALFGPTDPRIWSPLGPNAHVIHATSIPIPMSALAVQPVLAKLRELLSPTP